MSSGEGDGRTLRYPHSLDATSKCEAAGCDWNVWLPETHCPEHGGTSGWVTRSDEWGAMDVVWLSAEPIEA